MIPEGLRLFATDLEVGGQLLVVPGVVVPAARFQAEEAVGVSHFQPPGVNPLLPIPGKLLE